MTSLLARDQNSEWTGMDKQTTRKGRVGGVTRKGHAFPIKNKKTICHLRLGTINVDILNFAKVPDIYFDLRVLCHLYSASPQVASTQLRTPLY